VRAKKQRESVFFESEETERERFFESEETEGSVFLERRNRGSAFFLRAKKQKESEGFRVECGARHGGLFNMINIRTTEK